MRQLCTKCGRAMAASTAKKKTCHDCRRRDGVARCRRQREAKRKEEFLKGLSDQDLLDEFKRRKLGASEGGE